MWWGCSLDDDRMVINITSSIKPYLTSPLIFFKCGQGEKVDPLTLAGLRDNPFVISQHDLVELFDSSYIVFK